jgi:hypothetical protein
MFKANEVFPLFISSGSKLSHEESLVSVSPSLAIIKDYNCTIRSLGWSGSTKLSLKFFEGSSNGLSSILFKERDVFQRTILERYLFNDETIVLQLEVYLI